MHNGHWPELALDGSVANDPKQTFTQFIDCSSKVEVGMSSMVANAN
jgi:hypothetical protein